MGVPRWNWFNAIIINYQKNHKYDIKYIDDEAYGLVYKMVEAKYIRKKI